MNHLEQTQEASGIQLILKVREVEESSMWPLQIKSCSTCSALPLLKGSIHPNDDDISPGFEISKKKIDLYIIWRQQETVSGKKENRNRTWTRQNLGLLFLFE